MPSTQVSPLTHIHSEYCSMQIRCDTVPSFAWLPTFHSMQPESLFLNNTAHPAVLEMQPRGLALPSGNTHPPQLLHGSLILTLFSFVLMSFLVEKFLHHRALFFSSISWSTAVLTFFFIVHIPVMSYINMYICVCLEHIHTHICIYASKSIYIYILTKQFIYVQQM